MLFGIVLIRGYVFKLIGTGGGTPVKNQLTPNSFFIGFEPVFQSECEYQINKHNKKLPARVFKRFFTPKGSV
jgi:hypothetical protein